ncbi:hypothetical protein Golax_009263, partial [Gossypium laxum]|nr:hypothetical protein [Gossypium laxum]
SSGSPPSAFQVPYDSFRNQNDPSETSDTCDLKPSADELEQHKLLGFNDITDGILSEARWLLETGLLPNSNSATRAIGYRQDKVLNFIYNVYNDQSGTLHVPESLQMKKYMSNKREAAELKAYRAKNRHFVHREDCSDILDWIRSTQE